MNRGTYHTPRMISAVIATIAGLSATSTVQAVPLPVGGSAATAGTTAVARPELAGAVVYANTQPYKIITTGGTVVGTGKLTDYVVREKAGTLDFYFQVASESTSTSYVTNARRSDFGGVTTDVDWRKDLAGSAGPFGAQRTSVGDAVSFLFTGNSLIAPGKSSYAAFIKTNATKFNVKGMTTLYGTLFTGASAGAARLITAQPDPTSAVTYHFYHLLPSDLNTDRLAVLGRAFGLTPTKGNPQYPSAHVFADANHIPRLIGDTLTGHLEFFPDLTKATNPVGSADRARAAAAGFLNSNSLYPALRYGQVVPGNIIALADGSVTKAAGAGGAVPGAVFPSRDIMQTVHFTEMIDGLPTVGPKSLLSVDVTPAGGIGLTRTTLPLGIVDRTPVFKPYSAAVSESNNLIAGLIGLLRKTDPSVVANVKSAELVNFEQGASYVQPAYRFRVEFVGRSHAVSGQTIVVAATTNPIEEIVNTPINQNPPLDAKPAALSAGLEANTSVTAIQYGIYVVRSDVRFLDDAWNSHLALDASNAFVSPLGFPWYKPVHFNQYYWDHPWLWENDPADGIADHSAQFVGANHVVLYEGHGAPWLVTTLSNCCDVIDYRTLPGYGGHNGKNGKTAYIAWHTCDSIPAPGDAYGGYFLSPASPFDVWFNVFRGLRGAYGARTTVDIYDGAGPSFSWSTGFGVPALSAWLHAESNAVTGHHDNWDMGSAVLLTGHENDCIYDITPGAIPGSLTMYWQHP